MSAADDLLQRVREALAAREPREVRIFGGTSFMVDDRMLLAVRRGRGLLLRIDPADQPMLVADGAHPAVMGADRPMGPGWVSVDEELLRGPALARWIAHADRWHASAA